MKAVKWVVAKLRGDKTAFFFLRENVAAAFLQRFVSDFLGNGRNTVSRVLFRKRELTEFCGKLGEFCKKLGEFALAHK